MRFLHTSDWHLGRIFHGLHLLEDQRAALDQIITLARDCKVDALLVAGDIYDRAVPPTEAVNLLDETLRRLVVDLKLPVILIAGNHDNPDRLNFGRTLFATRQLYIVGPVAADTPPIVLEDATGPVYFAPLPYCEPLTATELSGDKKSTHEAALQWQVDRMLRQIPEGARKVALAHVFLTGARTTPDSERPLAAGGATTVSIDCFKGFNYTALGHLHACQNNSPIVRYSGSLLKYSFAEASQKKAVHIVDLAGDGSVSVETIPLTAPHELAVLKGSFQDLLENPRTEHISDYLQIVLTDPTPVLDAKHRLEQVYPQILQLGYERLQPRETEERETARRKGLSTDDLFQAFFREVQGRDLTEAEKALFHQVVNDHETEGRNA